jgi:hypothetical protein
MTDLPGYLKQPPKHDHYWARPTTWLLGSKMVGSLKQLLLSQIHRGFDIRDWMSAHPIPPSGHGGAKPCIHHTVSNAQGKDAYWIDYVSDTGDAQRLVYQLAYLLQQDVLRVESKDATKELPRGVVLIIGGDTAYPVADEPLLNERVRAPFQWARERLEREKARRLMKEQDRLEEEGRLENEKDRLTERSEPVLLFGIPANHDYYDMLNGFARQFRAPCTNEEQGAAKDGRLPLLNLRGYKRMQQASYFALQLPFGWHLWGIDAQDGLDRKDGLDIRQVEYFRSIEPQPKKLIVASAQPVIVQRAPIEEKHPIDIAYGQLRLPRVYRGANEPFEADQARIDLSGDVHVYERYYGAACCGVKPSDPEPGAETQRNYAAVVSGLGGVFHHPGQVRFGDVAAQAAWPPPAESARDIGWKLMRPRMVAHAGSAGILGAAVATLFWLLATDPTPSALHLPWLIATGDTQWPAVLGALGRSFVYLCCVGAWCALVAGARWWRDQVHEAMEPAPETWHPVSRCLFHIIGWAPVHSVLRFFGGDQRNAHAFVLAAIPRIVVVAGFLGLVKVATLDWFAFGGAHTAANIIVLLFLGAMLWLGWKGRKHLGPAATFLILVLAFVHGGLQIVTPLLWTPLLLDCPLYVPAVLLGCFILPRVSKPLLGTGARTRQIVFFALWLVLAAVFVALPLLESVARPVRAWPDAMVAAGTGAFFACLWLGWYFLVSLQWNAHGNEAASVARVDRYAAFLRIKLTDESAEVWAIQADEDKTQAPNELGERKIVARLIDHFRVDVTGTSEGSSGQ